LEGWVLDIADDGAGEESAARDDHFSWFSLVYGVSVEDVKTDSVV
jgi:hypothetical protein